MAAETVVIDRYGVMGYPVSHSRSPVIHRLFALQTQQNMQYELLQVSPEKLETAVRQFQRTGGKGLNITVPHKQEVAKLADLLSDRARKAGAVNTLTFQDSGISGDNTDGIGLLRYLVVNLGLNLEGANILILGAGGSTRGIVGPLLEMQPASLRIANRSLGKAEDLVEHFDSPAALSACRFNAVPVKYLFYVDGQLHVFIPFVYSQAQGYLTAIPQSSGCASSVEVTHHTARHGDHV